MAEPSGFRLRSVAVPGLVVAVWLCATYAGTLLDERLMTWLSQPGPFSDRSLREWLQPAFRQTLDAAVFLTVVGVLITLPNRRRLVASWLIGIVLSALLTRVMKIVIGRSRPRAEVGADAFDPLSFGSVSNSFPSGHTSSAFAMALLLAIYFPRGRIIFGLLAVVVGLERIRANAHFLSDVIAGAGVGVLAVYISYRALGPRFFDIHAAPGRPADSGISRG